MPAPPPDFIWSSAVAVHLVRLEVRPRRVRLRDDGRRRRLPGGRHPLRALEADQLRRQHLPEAAALLGEVGGALWSH